MVGVSVLSPSPLSSLVGDIGVLECVIETGLSMADLTSCVLCDAAHLRELLGRPPGCSSMIVVIDHNSMN